MSQSVTVKEAFFSRTWWELARRHDHKTQVCALLLLPTRCCCLGAPLTACDDCPHRLFGGALAFLAAGLFCVPAAFVLRGGTVAGDKQVETTEQLLAMSAQHLHEQARRRQQ